MKSTILILLVGQFWISAVAYCDWLTDSQKGLIELYCCDDSELKIEDTKKDKDDKLSTDPQSAGFDLSQKIAAVPVAEDFLSAHHPDITTPPPQTFLSL